MAGELQVKWMAGRPVYFVIRNRIGQVWNNSNLAFEAYNTALYAQYILNANEQGTASGFYVGTFPALIPPGSYSVVALLATAGIGNEAETDPAVGEGNIEWNGSAIAPLSDTATSGQISRFLPVRLPRGQMVRNYPIYLRSAADHITPLVSGVISGRIALDGATVFQALQSGTYTEVGQGYYWVNTLTSGDLNGDTGMLLFTAVGVGGGASDPLPIGLVMQKSG